MNSQPTSLMWHLMRKEWRQLFPLIAMLSVLAASFQVLDLAIQHITLQSSTLGLIATLGLPSMFAIGVGAMLVGQEKDSRTMLWLRSMPIAKEQLLRSKLVVALLSLLLIWLVSLTLFVGAQWFSRDGLSDGLWKSVEESGLVNDARSAALWSINTVFLTIGGLALAWKFKSSLGGLIAIIPFATVPWIATGLLEYWMRDYLSINSTSVFREWISVACLLIGTGIALVCGWRIGLQTLSASLAPEIRKASWVRTRDRATGQLWTQLLPQPQAIALVRQFVRQNRIPLALISVVLLVTALFAGCSMAEGYVAGGDQALMGLVACLATSWLGVLAFHGDQLHKRIGFLSDRGVSPWLVWRTRHVVPVIMLFAISAVFFTVSCLMLPYRRQHSTQWQASNTLNHYALTTFDLCFALGVSLAVFGALIAVYLWSQWVGQWLRSPIVASIVAPVMVALVEVYFGFLVVEVGAPIFVLVVPALIPAIATARLMQSWMDGRVGWGYHLRHACWLVLCAILPLIPLAYGAITSPRMPVSVERELSKLAREEAMKRPTPPHLVMSENIFRATEEMAKGQTPTARFREAVSRHRQELLPYIKDNKEITYPMVKYLVSEVAMARMRLESNNTAQSQATYRESLELIQIAATASRQRSTLVEQDVADILEIALIQELHRTKTVAALDADWVRTTSQSLANSQARDLARRRALASGWSKLVSHPMELGGYRLPEPLLHYDHRNSMTGRQEIGVMVTHLWNVLEAKEESSVKAARSVVWKDWNGNRPLPSQEIAKTHLYDLNHQVSNSPGVYWRGDWERDAVKLYESLSQSHNQTPKPSKSEVPHE
jgi:hypothetical protein